MRTLRWLIPLAVLAGIAYLAVKSYPNWYRTETKPEMTVPPCSIRVQVLNASNDPNAGRDVHEYLSRKGFDVCEDKAASEILPRTRVIDRCDPQLRFARAMQSFMSLPGRRFGPFRVAAAKQPEIGVAVDSLLYLDVTVRLGDDYHVFFAEPSRPF